MRACELPRPGGYKDWQLMATIRGEDYMFVTNNRTDFTALYAQGELHAGLVIIIPNVTPSRQRDLFQAALSHIGSRDLTNAVLEVDLVSSIAICAHRGSFDRGDLKEAAGGASPMEPRGCFLGFDTRRTGRQTPKMPERRERG